MSKDKNAKWAPNSFRFVRKDFHQEDGHSSDLDQKISVILFVRTTLQRTRFHDVQHAIIMATVWVDDDMMKSDYNFRKKTWITYAWCNRTMRRPTPMTTWKPNSYLIHASERRSSTLSSPFHPTSYSSYSPYSSIPSSSCCPPTSTRISGNTVYSANKEMESYDESYLPTGYELNAYVLKETYVES